MGLIDDNTLSGSGSPRFGISDENSDDYSIKNRINNPQVASFWMRTMQQSSAQHGDSAANISNLKLNARWDTGSNSEEATGLSSPSADEKTSEDGGTYDSDDSSRNDGEAEASAAESNSVGLESQSEQISESLSESASEIESQEIEQSEPEEIEETEGQSDRSESSAQDTPTDEALRFAWWTKSLPTNSSSAPSSAEQLTLTASKKKAALECLTERLQRAIHDGADSSSCLNLLESIKIVAETDEIAEYAESAQSVSRTSSRLTDHRHRHNKSRQHSRRRKSPSNRELREGLIALSQFIEHKLDEVATKTSASSSSQESHTRTDHSVSQSSSQDTTSSTSSSDISERIRLEKEQKIVQLEQDCSSYKSTIEELKSLINAQNSNLQSTLAALEHMERDRAEKADALVVLRETDKKKSDFIITLQQESTQLREELEAVHPAALNLQKINQSLRQDLNDLKDRYEELRRSERNVSELENRIAELQSENQQLEADVLSMIKCCSEYKKVIEEVQKRSGTARTPVRRGIMQTSGANISSEEAISIDSSPPQYRAHAGCQTIPQANSEDSPPKSRVADVVQKASTGEICNDNSEMHQELMYLRNKVHRLEEERDEADDLLFLAKEEKKLLKLELSRLTGDVRKKDSRISELEFMLDCETEFSKSVKSPSLECAIKSVDDVSDVSSTRESFGWIKNVFSRGPSGGTSTPTFGSNAALQSGR